ncbi:MAG: hypothetical protein N6V49_13520, partial [Serratia symbiotica]|nr:hypothetical protein [Serratia symbiotica]
WLAAHRQCVAGHGIAERHRFRAGTGGKLPAVAVGSAAGLGVRAGRVSGIPAGDALVSPGTHRRFTAIVDLPVP